MSHSERLAKEVKWYEGQFQAGHLLNRWPLYSQTRNNSAYAVAKTELMRVAASGVPYPERILVAPCGEGNDYPFVRAVWPKAHITGLDIAKVLPDSYVGDILDMPFPDSSFDVVLSTLFFHHVADEGYAPYLRELQRVLRKGGHLLSMEPSCYHPLFLVTRPLMKVAGNITGQVDHEHPISVSRLAECCWRNGFAHTSTFPCSFAHNRLPTALRFINRLPLPTSLAWQVGIIATK